MDLVVMPPVLPMLAKTAPALPEGEGFLFEPKWDGFRTIAFRDGDEVELGSRNARPLTRYFPEVVVALRASLPERCVLDGEIVIVGTGPGTGTGTGESGGAGESSGKASGGGLDFDALLTAFTRRRHASSCWHARRRRRSWCSTCWPWATKTCGVDRSPSGELGLRRP